MSSREERLQKRLRGNNTREIGEVDFGLVFASRAAVSSTPPSEAQPTPQPLPSQLPTQRAPSSIGRESAGDSTSTPITKKQLVHNANTSAKLRKLDIDPALSSRSTRSSQRRPRPDITTLVEGTQIKAADVSSNVSVPEPIIDESTIPAVIVARDLTPVRAIEEVMESPANAPGSGRRTRTVEKVSLASSQLQNVLERQEEEEPAISPVPQRKRKRKEPVPREPSPDLSQNITAEVTSTNEPNIQEISPEQPVRDTKHRKRIVEPEIDDEIEAEEINDEEAAAVLHRNERRRSSRIIPTVPSELVRHVFPIFQKRKGRPRVDLSPAQQRQPKTNPKAPTKPISKGKIRGSDLRSKRHGSPIPVTVHRMTKGVVYDDGEHDANILNAQIARPKQGDPNAIDVLSQVCQEIIISSLELLEDTGNKSEDIAFRRELKTKWDGVEAFGRELQTRLLEHTIILDNDYSLQRRLRDEQKRKLDLREQISRIRAEREQVALRMDKVRIRHENESVKALSRDSLNNAVQDIELAIDLGKSSQNDSKHDMIGSEFLLKQIAGQVSNKSDSGGLLLQLKEANAFFARAALVLEGKRI